jgi:hypothetical protein
MNVSVATHTLRVGLLPTTEEWTRAGLLGRRATESMFSWDEGGSSTSLLGTGVASFSTLTFILGLGNALAFVDSFKHEEGSGETCDLESGEEAAAAGDDFWKNDMMERCLEFDDAGAAGLEALAGVRALPDLSPGAMVKRCW